jgi:methylated-DNA-[protein]-cysteine S-methyltransferase
MNVGMTNSDAISITVFSSELGWMGLLWSDAGLSRLIFGYAAESDVRQQLDCLEPSLDPLPSPLGELVLRLQRFASGAPDTFGDVPIDHAGRTVFQRVVLEQCRQIPIGTVVTYSQLAAAAGHPRAARAVGSVMAGNRVPLVIPCHRVVAAGGRLGGFSAPAGTAMKRRLLELEKNTHSGSLT